MKPYRTICISVYAEELIAIDAKVLALKEAGYTRANRSLVLRAAAMEIGDDGLVEATRRRIGDPVALRREQVRRDGGNQREGKRCGDCGIVGHTRRTCRGFEAESAR